MDEQTTIFDQLDPGPKARATDPWTSHNAAQAMKLMGRSKNQRWKLLQVYASTAAENGLTSEEAARIHPDVALTSEYSTRCSELQRMGLIKPTGETRKGAAGVQRDVYLITDRGWEVVG